jgi:hypothetical protein
MEDSHQYELKALTPIWTGDANRQGDRLITTGLLGSIRWWFEVLVLGLGGSACDPTRDSNRCPGHRKKPTDRAIAAWSVSCSGARAGRGSFASRFSTKTESSKPRRSRRAKP